MIKYVAGMQMFKLAQQHKICQNVLMNSISGGNHFLSYLLSYPFKVQFMGT